jgi:hypothetical protein
VQVEEGWEVVSNSNNSKAPKARAASGDHSDWTHVWGGGAEVEGAAQTSYRPMESKGEKLKREAAAKLKTTQRKNEKRRSKKEAVLQAQRERVR